MRLLSCFASSPSWCGLVCSVWLWQLLVILIYFLNWQFLYSSWKWYSKNNRKFFWWCPLSFAWVLRGFLTMNQTQKLIDNCNYLVLFGHFCEVVQINLLSEFRYKEYLFLRHYYFWNDLLPFKLFLSPTRLCLWDVHQFAKAVLFPLMFTSSIYVYHIKFFKCSTFLKRWLIVSMKANVL